MIGKKTLFERSVHAGPATLYVVSVSGQTGYAYLIVYRSSDHQWWTLYSSEDRDKAITLAVTATEVEVGSLLAAAKALDAAAEKILKGRAR